MRRPTDNYKKCSNVYAQTDKISAFRIEKKHKIMKNEIFAGM